MGGLLIIVRMSPTLLWANLTNPFIWIVLSTIAFGAVGFTDDYLKSCALRHGLHPR